MAKRHATRPFGLLAAIALGAAALFGTPPSGASAATSHKQSAQPVKKLEAKKPELRKPEAKKPESKKLAAGKPGASTATKDRAAAKKTAREKGKPQKHAAKSKRSKKVADEDEEDEEKPAAPALTGDLAAVKNAIDLARKGKTEDATDAAKAIADPAGQKLAEWYLLRHSETQARFARYAAFLTNNPDWPSNALLRRRAEARLWQEKADAATIRTFFAEKAPLTAKGRFALARVYLADGDRLAAAREVKAAWRSEELGEATEEMAYEEFRDLLAREDHRARMDKRIGAKEISAAMRAAKRLGDNDVAIVKACGAVTGDADKALGKLNDVPEDARGDLGYVLCRVKWAMKKDKIVEAAKMVIAAAPETMAQQDTDEWWRDRRTLSRKLLDMGEFQMAYDVVKDAATPGLEAYRADYAFMPGWIALRYLNDPATASKYFADIDKGLSNPITLARANYWRARAREAAGDARAARAFYEASAKYPTAYYGQISRAKLGLEQIELRAPKGDAATDERVRAFDMLYAIGEREMPVKFAYDLAEECTDEAVLAALGEVTFRRNDAISMLQLGKTALGRGLALDHYAFPTIGIPAHKQVGTPEIEHGMIYAVARTESAFDQKDHSHADAVGLMQVTPEAGKDTAKRFGLKYDWEKMRKDPVYNTQMGAGELSALIGEYKGSHIMTFAGYNAGRGRVRDWIKARGDPRDPNVDPVDWVERIPFSETRNYVQRVMENLLVYRVRFGPGTSAPVMAKPEQSPAAGPATASAQADAPAAASASVSPPATASAK
jgi:soluble lytic murein transglycosylase